MDSEINITMMENPSQGLHLHFATQKVYPCINFPIDLSLNQSGNAIDITFNGVIESNICLTAIGPATAKVDLGVLNTGTYQLNFYDGQQTQSGELIVSADSYKVNLADNSLVRFVNKPVHKIPESSIWIAVNYSDEQLVQSFLGDLLKLEVTEKIYPIGYYTFENDGYPGLYSGFKVGENDKITFQMDMTKENVMMGRPFTQSFVFQYSGSTSEIEQLVRQYRAQIEIRAYTDKGDQFLSWRY